MFHAFWSRATQRIAHHLQQCAADPVRSVVLLPFAQLLPLARQQWALTFPDSLLPRFETSTSWARRLRPFVPGATDLAFDAAMDLLTAQTFLQRAGLAAQAQWLAPRVREAALQLAPIAAAQPPAQRMAWAARMQEALRADNMQAPEYEQKIAALALAWAGHSAYATDILFEQIDAGEPASLIVLQGLQHDPLAAQLHDLLAAQRPQAACMLEMVGESCDTSHATSDTTLSPVQLHHASHFEDLAQRAAACVQRAVGRQQGLIALVDTDRALTRRIRALLEGQGLALRDETGWKLSTTHAASQVLLLLRACVPQADSDAVLAWLKLAQATALVRPAASDSGTAVAALHCADVDTIEAHLRHHALARWPATGYWHAWQQPAAALALQTEGWRQRLQAPRSLAQWLADVRTVLQATGQWHWLQDDPAGQALIQTLHWQSDTNPLEPLAAHWTLADFRNWVAQTLEAGHFNPPHPPCEQAAIVPLAQLLARPFSAVVLPGCDEKRLPASPDLPGLWTAAQRTLLGLPGRAQVQQAQRSAWQHLLQTPQLDVLLSHHEDNAAVLPSPLLLEWQLAAGSAGLRAISPAADPRDWHRVPAQPAERPQPQGQRLPVLRLSASGYDALRICPYRFFALYQLRLRETPELTGDVEKRDFGTWLHRTLLLFHEGMRARNEQAASLSPGALRQHLDAAAQQARREQHFDAAAFLPYELAWPSLRDGYLRWLTEIHAPMGADFVRGEAQQMLPLNDALGAVYDGPLPPHPVQLAGSIDRIDRYRDSGALLLIDYKTEAADNTRQRIRQPGEDTQLLFYAALLAPEPVRAGYLNVGERGETVLHLHEDAATHAQHLLHGMAQDLTAIAAGAPLPALGQGRRCDHCAARGLCRRDFWEETA